MLYRRTRKSGELLPTTAGCLLWLFTGKFRKRSPPVSTEMAQFSCVYPLNETDGYEFCPFLLTGVAYRSEVDVLAASACLSVCLFVCLSAR